MRYVIEGDLHAEWMGEFETLGGAMQQLRNYAEVPWDQEPNQAPCVVWETCGRNYFLIEFDDEKDPWEERSRRAALNVCATGIEWQGDLSNEAG